MESASAAKISPFGRDDTVFMKFCTKRYSVHRLVWYELHESMESAIKREKSMKEWKRAWKLELIESANPDWEDLYHAIT